MTAQQPTRREPAAAPGAMAFDRLQAIGAAAGNEAAAGWPQQGGDPAAVELDQGQQQGLQGVIEQALHGGSVGSRGSNGCGGEARNPLAQACR